MTRKQAILALLALPAAVVAQAPPTAPEPPLHIEIPTGEEGTLVSVPVSWFRPSPAILTVELNDKDVEAFGVCEITVSYRGKIKTFSAKEIWVALA